MTFNRRLLLAVMTALALVALAPALVACDSGDGTNSADSITNSRTTTTLVPSEKRADAQAAEFDPSSIFGQVSAGVVTVRAIFAPDGDVSAPGAGGAEGSGFVLSDDGEIITNAHVVTVAGEEGGQRAAADEVYVEFADRNVVVAEIVGSDPFYDVALLKVDAGALDLTALEPGDDSELVTGQPVAAIGSPFGEQQSLSVGVISATERSVRSLTEFQIEGAIQTDASINPGNSGGPLLDARGRVIGINQQIETQTGRSDGVGFAVPISAVLRSAEQLRENGRVAYPYIGVSSQSLYPQLARRLDLDTEFGGLIANVVPQSPAAEAGLRGGGETIRFQAGRYQTGGDVILSVDERPVIRPDDLARHVVSMAPGDDVTLEILRDGKRRRVELTLGERPVGANPG